MVLFRLTPFPNALLIGEFVGALVAADRIGCTHLAIRRGPLERTNAPARELCYCLVTDGFVGGISAGFSRVPIPCDVLLDGFAPFINFGRWELRSVYLRLIFLKADGWGVKSKFLGLPSLPARSASRALLPRLHRNRALEKRHRFQRCPPRNFAISH